MIGNKDQAERMIAELKRIADSLAVLADREREAIEEKLDELLERMADKERRN